MKFIVAAVFLVCVLMFTSQSVDALTLYGLRGRGNSQHTGLYFIEGEGYIRMFGKGTWSGPFVEGRIGSIMINSAAYNLNQNYQVMGGVAVGFKSPSEYPWRTLDGIVSLDASRNLRRLAGDVTIGFNRLFIGANYRRSIIPANPADILFSENIVRIGGWLSEHLSFYLATRSMTYGYDSFVSQTVVPLFPFGLGITVLANPFIIQGVVVKERVRTLRASRDEVTGWIVVSTVFSLSKED